MTPESTGLDATLRRAEGLVAAAQALAFALEDLPAINLPAPSGAAMDQAQIRAVAALYLASELDAAGAIDVVEDLVRLARSGGIEADLGAATPLLESFWLSRQERPTAAERQSCFESLFGSSSGASPPQRVNAEFEDRLIDLCEALYKLDEQATNATWGGVPQQARVRAAALQLLDNLSRTAGGLTVFLAQEILATLKQSLQILNHPGVLAAFGSRSVRDAIRAIERQLRRPPAGDYDVHVRRGQAGMTILSWLADAAPLVSSSAHPLVGVDHPVIPAAVDWLQASLSLTEGAGSDASAAPAASPPPSASPSANPSGDDWAALAR
jgi:hypothetical protein